MLVFDRPETIRLATGDMKIIKRSGPRTEPYAYCYAYAYCLPMHIVLQNDYESTSTKDVRFVTSKRIQKMTKPYRLRICSSVK